MLMDREQRLAGDPVEDVDVTLLGNLRQRVDRLAVPLHGKQRRLRRKVAVPYVVMHALKMPKPLARTRIQRQQRVGIEIVAQAVASVKVHHGRTRGHVHNAVRRIQSHACPVVRCARRQPRVRRPRLSTGLARMRNRVKGPNELARAHIKRADVSRWRRMRFRIPSAHDDQVLVHHARSGQGNRLLQVVAAQPLAQIDAALLAKRGDGLARLPIQTIQKIHDPGEDAFFLAVGPVSNAAGRLRTAHAGVELPLQLAGRGIHGNHFLRGCVGIQRASHNQGIVLQPTLFAGVEGPCGSKAVHVDAVDLGQL